MKQLFLIFTAVLMSNITLATEPFGRISGRVIDAELKEPIPYATISITNTDGEMVQGETTAEDGSFSLNKIRQGTYAFKVQFMGYKSFSKEIEITRQSSNYNFGNISLEPEVAMLDGVTVVAERTTIEQRIDRKVINVGKDLTTTGASASEIMNNVPSVNVDQDGNIALRGNANVRILIDGKPTNMDPAQLLKQIPSTSIKTIELITNPSAKYNPEGNSGIINIVLHKNTNDGFNGNFNAGVTVGKHTRTNASLDLNYRKGKFNFYGNFGGQFGEKANLGRINFTEANYKQAFDVLNSRESYLYKIGVDFYLDEQNTFSFYTNQNLYNGGPEGAIRIIYPANPELDLAQNLDSEYDNTNSTYNFAFDHKFNEDGHKILFEADYNDYEQDENSVFNFEGNTAGYEDYRDHVKEKRENIIANIDYENPLTENSKLEIGAEARLLDTDNTYTTNSDFYSNSTYQYKRDIYSFYTTYGQNFEKWSYQVGARLENFKVDAIYNNKNVFTDEYFNIYPSGFLNYTPGETNSYQLSYSRRVDRPNFGQVNPIREISSPRLTVTGNPELEPQFTNSFEFNYTRSFKKKGSLTTGIFYRNINDEISQVFVEDPNEAGSLLLQYENFENNNSYGLELSTNYKFTKWWSTNTSFELYSQDLKGVVGEDYLETDNTAWTFRTNHSFKTTDKLTFQVFGFYRSASKQLQVDMDPMYFVNLGARYSLLNDKATISLNFNDVFDTQEFSFTNGRPLPQEGRFKGESQNVYLGFSYRFGGGKSRSLKRKKRDDNQANGGGVF
ncbi:Outer membrane receptor for ferrienterochelin and colicins [Salegentibacter echinorum]|uniref:Outer membrane receptor for ferrienterochelin and colicins n=1 Tax=Salegentibacter echinorum TaxID=1073325 RepID=A0A1M5C5Y6_SALEC|nr:TonB-dependent receptor [Salegentibacter echinorum]SHF49832.1 Outer membrane receptor for ferrienterochelin and colicins [Salegentibacter echinorum]